MSRRFEIQDIVAQDSSGVTFLALDVQTGLAAAVRRFFPYGANGGGLFDEERSDYTAVAQRLIGLEHPGLRMVLSGGCDPVDGMPFFASEWIEGESLAEILERGTFTTAGAIEVLARVLEISEGLSEVLGAEAVWVETNSEWIIDDAGASSRGLTFSLAPMKWLGHQSADRSLLPLAHLAEDLLGWRRKRVPYQAGQGLGAWLKWLRANADILTLRQVRERLAAVAEEVALEAQPGAAYSGATVERRQTPTFPVRPVRLKKSSSKEPWLMIAGLAVLVAAAAWWLFQYQVSHKAATAAAAEALATGTAADPPVPAANTRLAQNVVPAAAVADTGQQQPPAANPLPDGVFGSGESVRIMQQEGKKVTVEGVLKNIRVTDSGKTLYLEFVETSSALEVRGRFVTKNAPDDMSEEAIKPLLGKRVRITGVVKIMHKLNRWPEVLLKNRQAIEEVR
ncbi:MAG: hypothetical protein WCJ66_07285 [Verrucomicrobiota bacterium]